LNCFSGEVREGQTFRKDLNADLEFVLRLPGGFDVVSKHREDSCKLSSWVANPPLRAHHATEIDAAFDWSAEQEVQMSPREFHFVTNCADYQALYDLSETDAEKYFAHFDSLAKGQGRLWITDSRVTHAHDSSVKGNGAIEWMKFSVEIKLSNPSLLLASALTVSTAFGQSAAPLSLEVASVRPATTCSAPANGGKARPGTIESIFATSGGTALPLDRAEKTDTGN
jgi:hypothetical protein